MNEHPHAQTFGTILIALLGLLLYVAAKLPALEDRRRSALYIVAIYLGFVAIIRLMVVADFLEQEPARIVNGFVAGVFALSLIDALFVTPWIYGRLARRR